MIIGLHSYRGGTGKSLYAAELARCYADLGLSVAVMDLDKEHPADLGKTLKSHFGNQEIPQESVGLLDHYIPETKALMSGDEEENILGPLNGIAQACFENPPLYEQNGGSIVYVPLMRTFNPQLVYSLDMNDYFKNWEGNGLFVVFQNNLRSNFDVVLLKGQSGLKPLVGYQFADTVAMLTNLNDAREVGIICDRCTGLEAVRNLGKRLPVVVIPNNFCGEDPEVRAKIKSLYNSELADFNDSRAVMGSQDPFELLALPYQKDIAESAWAGTGFGDVHGSYFQRLAFALAQTADPQSRLFLAANQVWGGMSGSQESQAIS